MTLEWTSDRLDELARHAKNGRTMQEAADALHCSVATITRVSRRYAIKWRRGRPVRPCTPNTTRFNPTAAAFAREGLRQAIAEARAEIEAGKVPLYRGRGTV
jgi:hypothetical protein